jgi:hypothetical protein
LNLSTTSGFKSIMAIWSSYISSTLFRVIPAGSGVIVVNVAVFGILSVSQDMPYNGIVQPEMSNGQLVSWQQEDVYTASEAEAGGARKMFGRERRAQLTYLFRKLRPNLASVLIIVS